MAKNPTFEWGGNPKISVYALSAKSMNDEVPLEKWNNVQILLSSCPFSRALQKNKYDYIETLKKYQPCLDCWPNGSHNMWTFKHTFTQLKDGITFIAQPNQIYYWFDNQFYGYKIVTFDEEEQFRLISHTNGGLMDSHGVHLEEYGHRTSGQSCFQSVVNPLLLRLGYELIALTNGFCARESCNALLNEFWWKQTIEFRSQILKLHPIFRKLLTHYLETTS